ncbi:hypothetical protein ABE354_08805 [Brevibacillus laterosporus]
MAKCVSCRATTTKTGFTARGGMCKKCADMMKKSVKYWKKTGVL